MFTTAKDNAMFVVSLDIDPMGQATERIPDLEKSAQLHNTLLQGLFPDIRVARLNVPGGVLDESQQALVEQTMKRVNVDGVQFRLVGVKIGGLVALRMVRRAGTQALERGRDVVNFAFTDAAAVR